ncbi:hypothetical protein GUJ93_ZPchr0006g41652 [Zizania palustris]|uniref:Uncharacterized protein n=1 Tax=Zizania palustris TaxID=103762 RepID=A0A8J5W1K3_ZIZPA|nr:hypothetical protein GUJ93_ZPchr0006g41652 [Zizania palustris]
MRRSAVVLVRNPCVHQSSGSGEGSTMTLSWPPEIEVRLSEKSVLLRIHCGSAKGMLVRVLAEVDDLRLAIILHTPASCPSQPPPSIHHRHYISLPRHASNATTLIL